MITMQQWEHWSKMTNGEIVQELFTMIIITVVIGIITGVLTYIKNKYYDKVIKSNSRILKFIFKNIL